MKRRSATAKTVRWTTYHVVMGAVALLFVAPMLWMMSTAFKPERDVLVVPPRWIPADPTLEHFGRLFGQMGDFPVARWLFNSFFVSTSVTILVLLVSSMAAYALSRLHFRGRDHLLFGILSTLFIPAPIFLIPVFLIIVHTGLFNTYGALILPALGGAFGVFLLRQFFTQLPIELEEAAYLDGATPWTIYLKVVLPLSKPVLATLAIFTFLGTWNDFALPLIATNSIELRTLPVGLSIFQGRFVTEYGLTMAAALVATLPMVVAFLFMQKSITEGIALTGLKG